MQIAESVCQMRRMATPGCQLVDCADGTIDTMRDMLEKSALTIERRRRVDALQEDNRFVL
jgi:hypothetical protein